MKYSIIIITYNEEEKIIDCITSVSNAAKNFSDFEIIVSDGGSTDNTRKIVESEGALFVESEIGRGSQNNTGARFAKGEVLIFLHADTLFPKNGFEIIDAAFKNINVKIGTFKMMFDEEKLIYKIYSYFTKIDSVFTSFGDQCIVIRKSFFNHLNGFPNWQIFEDVHFLRKTRKETKIISLNSTVITSARRFKENGLLVQQIRNLYYIFLYLIGNNHIILQEKYVGGNIKATKESLIIFAKYPEKGKVKTRLGQSIGFEKATEIYTRLAEHSFNEAKKVNRISRYLFYVDEINRMKITNWVGSGFDFLPQGSGNLGIKMKNAFSKVFKKVTSKAIIIGSDLPDISKSLISKAFKDLDRKDIVIGPSKDGGYYLLGMNKFYPQIFDGISWSTEQVLEQTLAKIESLNLSVILLKELNDIDTIEDLDEWQNRKTQNENSNSLVEKLVLVLR